MRRIRPFEAILAIGLAGSAACTGVSPLAPDGVALQVTADQSELTMIGARTRLRLQLPDGVLPAAGSVAWRSNAPSVAVVDGEGMVTAVGDGVANITAEVGGLSASTTITVAATILSVATVRLDQEDVNPQNDAATVAVRVQAE